MKRRISEQQGKLNQYGQKEEKWNDLKKRFEDQRRDLKTQLEMATTKRDELSDQVKALEGENKLLQEASVSHDLRRQKWELQGKESTSKIQALSDKVVELSNL